MSVFLRVMKSDHDVYSCEFTKAFDVSQRTIRNEVNTINELLKSEGLEEIVIGPSGIISYDGDKNLAMESMLQGDFDFYTYKLNKEERKTIISLMLLNCGEYITISSIAEEVCISRQTLINDLDEVKKEFTEFDLEIQSNSNKGLCVSGNENYKREMMLSIIYRNANSVVEETTFSDPFSGLMMPFLFGDLQKVVFEKSIKLAEEKYNSYFTDTSYIKVLYYTMVVIWRIVTHNSNGEMVFDKLEKNFKYEMAEEILQGLCEHHGIACTEAEIYLLSEVLGNQRYIRNESSNNRDALKIQVIATRFISVISEELNINLNNDFIFYENLIAHLEATLMQEFDVANTNPVLDILTQNYSEIFQVTRKHIYMFSKFVGRTMNEHEISYVVMHICAAMERRKNAETPAKVIVVCGGGVGTGQLLVEKLRRQFKFDILEVTSVHNLSEELVEKADLIISTIALRNVQKASVIITPLLSDSDYLKIQKVVKTLHLKEGKVGLEKGIDIKQLLEQFEPIFKEYVPLHQQGEFLKKIQEVASTFVTEDIGSGTGLYLYELLREEHILLDVKCENYKEAIMMGGNLLLETGEIDATYIGDMIGNIEENGPYFVISEGFAVPHAPISAGVKDVGMSLLRLKNPMIFIDADVGEIEFVCCLSAIDAESHTRALFNLINLLEDDYFKSQLRLVETPAEMTHMIQMYENEICSNRGRRSEF